MIKSNFQTDFEVRRRDGLLATEVDGELVGLHVEKGTCYGFNGTATRVWALIETPRSIAAIRDAMVAEFEVDPATCEMQLMDLLRELESDGLIDVHPAASTRQRKGL